MGPTLSFRGIDNRTYYYLMGDQRYYNDFTGTGNALELRHPYVLRMVTDSLRYWVEEMRIDGFRFDLATTLARVEGPFDEHASFLDAVAQDPVLASRQADRRAVGHRPRRLPGRPLPARLGRVERPVPRHHAQVLEGRRRPARGARLTPVRLGRHLPPPRPPALGERQLRHRARRLHAARPRQLRPQAQRGQQGRQPRRLRQQRQLELRRRGRDRRPGDQGAAPSPDAQLPGHAPALAGHADAASPATSSRAPRAATTTPTARTARSAGSTGTSDEEGEGLLAFTRRLIAAAPRAHRVPPLALLPRRSIPGTEVKDVTWLRAGRRGDGARRLARRQCEDAGPAARAAKRD